MLLFPLSYKLVGTGFTLSNSREGPAIMDPMKNRFRYCFKTKGNSVGAEEKNIRGNVITVWTHKPEAIAILFDFWSFVIWRVLYQRNTNRKQLGNYSGNSEKLLNLSKRYLFKKCGNHPKRSLRENKGTYISPLLPHSQPHPDWDLYTDKVKKWHLMLE